MKLHEVSNLLGQVQSLVEAPKTIVTKYEHDADYIGGTTRTSVTIENGQVTATVILRKPKHRVSELDNV